MTSSSSSSSCISSNNSFEGLNCLFEDAAKGILTYLEPRECVRAWIAIPTIRCILCPTNDFWFEVALRCQIVHNRAYSHSHDSDFQALLVRVGCATERSGLILLKLMHDFRKCFRSGCLRVFRECDNTRSSCRFHPGKRNPRTGRLSCCRAASFSEAGCASDFHCGRVFDAIKLGEVAGTDGGIDTSDQSMHKKALSFPKITTLPLIAAASSSLHSNYKQSASEESAVLIKGTIESQQLLDGMRSLKLPSIGLQLSGNS